MPTDATPEQPPPARTTGPGAQARGAGQVLAMAAIGVLMLLFAPIAIPLVLWIRWRDRRAARRGAGVARTPGLPWTSGAAGGRRPAGPPRPAAGGPGAGTGPPGRPW